MPAQSEKVINLRIQATDDGATGVLSKIGKTVNESLNGGGGGGGGGGGLLSQLKGGFGRGSEFTQTLKALQGGGAVLGLSLAGKELDALADKATQLHKELHEGSKSGAEVADELARSLPIFGSLYDAGRKFRALMDGTAADTARLAQENEITKALEGQIEAMGRIKKLRAEGEEATRRVRDQTALVGMADPGKTLSGLKSAREEIERTIEKNKTDLTADVGSKHSAELRRLQGLVDSRTKAWNDAKEALEDAKRGTPDAFDKKPYIESVIRPAELEVRAREQAKLGAESALKRQLDLRRQETDAALGKANDPLNAQLDKNDKEREEVERAAQVQRERLALAGEKDITEIRSKAAEQRLRFLGKQTQAELEALRTAYELEKKERQQKFNEDLYKAQHGGGNEDLVRKNFETGSEGRADAFKQSSKLAVMGGLRQAFLDTFKEASDAVSSFRGKDLIDSLLRKAGLKGIKVDRSLPHTEFAGLAPAVQVSQGGSEGYAIAERLRNQTNDPQQEVAKNTQEAAKSLVDLHGVVTGVAKAITDLVSKLNVTPTARPG